MQGLGGIDRRPNADPKKPDTGWRSACPQDLTHDTSLTVAVLPRTQVGNLVIDGLLGRDFLALSTWTSTCRRAA